MAYRHYVLFILLLVYIHCLLSRMLPAFLVSVPTPGCDRLCASTATAPLCHQRSGWEPLASANDQTFLHCQECRARVGAYSAEAVADGNWFNMRDGACIGRWQYGILMGYGFSLPFVLGSLVTARLVDVVNRQCILAVAVAVWSGASGIMAGVSSFEPLLLSRFLLGVSESFVVPASFSLIADYFDEASHGSAGSLLSAGVCLGAGAASWAVPLALRVGWRASCVLVGGAGVVLAALVSLTVHEPARQRAKARKLGRAAMRVQVVWILTAAASLRLAASYTIAAFLPTYYLRASLPGFSAGAYAAANASLVASTGLLSAVIGGIAADALGRHLDSAPSAIAACANLAAAVLYAGVFRARHFAVSMAFYGGALLVGECWYGLMLLQVKRAVPQAVQGQVLTLVLSVATVLSNAGPAATGALDPGNAHLGRILLCIVAAGTGLAAGLFGLAAWLVQSGRSRGCPAPAPLLETDSDESSPCASPSRLLMQKLARELELQVRRQVPVSPPGHAEIVRLDVGPDHPGAPSGHDPRCLGRGQAEL